MRIAQSLDELRDDVRLTFRQLRRSPGFTSVAVLTLDPIVALRND
jgi:hypothetical protein